MFAIMLTYWWLRSSLQLVQASMQASIPNILMVSIVDKEETPVRVGRVGAWGMTAPIQQGGEAGKPRGRRLLSSLHVSLSTSLPSHSQSFAFGGSSGHCHEGARLLRSSVILAKSRREPSTW